jgi:hypothetical protein
MVLGSPVKRRAVKGPLEKAGLAVAAALLLLVCAASLRCSAAFGSALAAPPRKLWGGGVSIAAEASGAAAEECDLFDGKWVWDDAYPLYESPDCPFLDVGFRCSENGTPRLLLHQVAVAAGALRSPEVGSSSCLLHWRLPQPPIPIPFPSLDWDGSEVCYCVKHGPLRLPGEEERPVRLKESEHLASNSLPQCLLNNVKFRSSPLSFIGSCSGIWIDDGAIKNYEARSVFDSRGGRRATLLGTRSTIGNSMLLACH